MPKKPKPSDRSDASDLSDPSDIPDTMLAWQLFGAGMESFGRDRRPCRIPTPRPGRDELLARVDAVGLCFSDVKILRLGGDHPRLVGRDLEREPVIPGHEASITIVEVGEGRRGRFHIGERYLVQADVYYKGVNLAYGYRLSGAMAEYSPIGREILDGDEGCYLMPISPDMGYAEVALVEPWACVEAAYRISYRTAPKPDGKCLVVGCPDRGLVTGYPHAPTQIEWAGAGDVGRLGEEFDDVLVWSSAGAGAIADAACRLARGGVITIVADSTLSEPVELDVGRFHYDALRLTAASPARPWSAYESAARSELRPGGRALFMGAGGPMGRMHVSRAIDARDGPSAIVATEIDDNRLSSLARSVRGAVANSGKDVSCVSPQAQPLGGAFDDIVILVPAPALIEQALTLAAPDAAVNVFAGIPKGTVVPLDLNPVLFAGVRIIGSSGSRIEDMRIALGKAERGEISTNSSVAAIGGLGAAWEGMKAVAEGTYPGKIVLYPQVRDLPLTGLLELRDRAPEAAAELGPGGAWTREAERALFNASGLGGS